MIKKHKEPFLGPALEPGPELTRLMDEEPEHLAFPLREFMSKFDFEFKDIVAELAAGRLMAHSNDQGIRDLRRGKMPDFVMVTLAAIDAWLQHPHTPMHFIAKINAGPNQLH